MQKITGWVAVALQKSIHDTSPSSSSGHYAWRRFQEQFCELAAGSAQAPGAEHLIAQVHVRPFSCYRDHAEILRVSKLFNIFPETVQCLTKVIHKDEVNENRGAFLWVDLGYLMRCFM